MLRITTGIAKNKRIIEPEIEGFRAVQEKAKLALFSIIGERINGAVCLDLFSGGGNLCLEALSRGASWCDMVDSTKICYETIKENVKNCGFLEVAGVSGQKATKFLEKTDKVYDFIFLDPFYNDTKHKYLVSLISEHIKDEGLVFFFHGSNLDMDALVSGTDLKIMEQRKYNESHLTILGK